MGFGIKLCWPPVDMITDFIYSIGMLFNTKRKLINMHDFEKIKQLEKQAYPDDQRAYENANSIKDYKKIFVCFNRRQIDYYLDDDCYCIVVLHHNLIYIADLVSLKNPQKTFRVLLDISRKYKDKPLYMYAREKTGYRLAKVLEKRGSIKILEDIVEDYEKEDDGEIYHMLKISII